VEKVTGVVLEKDGRYVVLLTPLGEFKRIRMKGKLPDIGEEVSVPVIHKRNFRMPKAGWIAAAAAVLILLVGNPLLTTVLKPPEAAMAYVSIDMKSSIELTVSDRYNVMDAQALNADGEKILKNIDLKGVKYSDAVTKIKDKASQMGYIKNSNDNTVLVSVAFLNDSMVDKGVAESTLVASANNIFADPETKVAALHVPTDLRDNANKSGISTGKYAVLIEAVNSGLPITEKDMQEKPVIDAISSAGRQAQQIITQAGEEKQFVLEEKKYMLLASRNDSEQITDAVYNENTQPAVSIAANEAEAKPVSDNNVPTKNSKDRKYVETIRKTGGPEDQRTEAAPKTEVSPAAAPEPAPVKTEQEPVSEPSVDTGANAEDDLKTIDNYMGSEQNTNNESPNSSDLNGMYKSKPNW